MSSDPARIVFHADHCGSLLRPPELREARRLHALGKLADAALHDIEDRAILGALELQRQAGLGIYSDGEFRRRAFHDALVRGFTGIEDGGPDFERFPEMRKANLGENPELATINPVVTGKIGARGRMAADEAAFLAGHAPGPYKITLPSPAMALRRFLSRPAGRAAYPSYEEFIGELAVILAAEARTLAEAGVPYIQLDAPAYTRFMLRDGVEQMKRQGIDPERELAAIVAAENLILRAAKDAGATTAVHICHGTYFLDGRGPSGGPPVDYDPELTQRLYHSLEADAFLVEYTERGGSACSLRDAPKGKVFALGLLNIRDPQLESQDAMLRKIEEAAQHVDFADLALCPNCGFSGASADAWISADDQRRKLDLLVATAAKLWGD